MLKVGLLKGFDAVDDKWFSYFSLLAIFDLKKYHRNALVESLLSPLWSNWRLAKGIQSKPLCDITM